MLGRGQSAARMNVSPQGRNLKKLRITFAITALALLQSAAPGGEVVSVLDRRDLWPPPAPGAVFSVAHSGLVVTVPAGRGHAIAATRAAVLPPFGRVRVRADSVSTGALWFVRISGELREAGRPRTVGLAEKESAPGEHVISVDPRMRTRLDAPIHIQLGVEGPPGAAVRFSEVALLPPPLRANVVRGAGQAGQRNLATVEQMPNLPQPYEMIDWRAKAEAFDGLAFDFKAAGEYLPLVWRDESRVNIDRPAFGLPSYVGGLRRDGAQEGVTCLGAVLGATVAGIDKSAQEQDYVGMCEAWFNRTNGQRLVLNNLQGGTGGSFWYEVFPSIVFAAIADRHPARAGFGEIVRVTADRWREACAALRDADGVPDFDHTAFNFRTMKPVDNGKWREPDAAAGVAWLEYSAWKRFGDSNHLAAAEACLTFLQGRMRNPHYEVLLPFGALTAARLNAECGRTLDVDRLLNWCFEPSDTRGGWGVILGRWGDYDCDGLVGSIDNRGGYAFAMNTFVQAGALVPLVRYDPRYARAIGKWMLNLANAARLFYPGAMPPGHESGPEWTGDPRRAIAYEGLRHAWQGKTPCATGDPVAMNWGPKTDRGLYGSAYAGLLGGIVATTDVPALLRLDCLATDFFRSEAYPTFLFYNPHPEARPVTLPAGAAPVRVYDAVSGRYLPDARKIEVPADGAVLAVLTPAGGEEHREGRRLLVNGVVIDYGMHRE